MAYILNNFAVHNMYSIAANTLHFDGRHFLGAVPEICFKKGDYYFMSLWGLFLQEKELIAKMFSGSLIALNFC